MNLSPPVSANPFLSSYPLYISSAHLPNHMARSYSPHINAIMQPPKHTAVLHRSGRASATLQDEVELTDHISETTASC
jgi:hypothetical protein